MRSTEFINPVNEEKWIQKAIKHKGGLHRSLHVPADQPIPAGKLEKATHSTNPRIKKQAVLAKTLKSLHQEDTVTEKAPPGMEDMVLKLKKEYPGEPAKAFATAWSIYNKKHGKR